MLDRGEYGELPPLKFSTQHWKGSGAALVYGATQEECLKLGARDFETAAEEAEGPALDPAVIGSLENLSDHLDDVEVLAGKPFKDQLFGRRFIYLKPELELYKRLGIAPPRKHPTRRIRELYAEMNIAVFETTACANCHKTIQVAKNTNYLERKIYCKSCYYAYLETR